MSADGNQGTRRALRLILALSGHSFAGLTLKTIADAVEQSSPTTLRDLQVLEQEGYVEQVPSASKCWRLSPRLVQVAIAHQAELTRLEQSVSQFKTNYSRTPH